MMKDSSVYEDYMAACIVLFGAFTTLIPAFAHSLGGGNKSAYVNYRPIVLLCDNILQVALGCYTHANIYPEASENWRGVALFRAVGVLVTGSGVAWLNMSGVLGSLIFRFAIGQQAVLTILMLMASPSICRRSFSLQKGHMMVHHQTVKWLHRLLPAFLAKVIPLINPPVTFANSPEDAVYALNVCLTYQPLVLLTLGLIAPTLYIFWREMTSRKQFAQRWGRQFPTVTSVVLNPPPTMLQYWAFAAPAVAALYYYVARGV